MVRLGVSHEDVRGPNLLWDPVANRPMIIDFERSELSPIIRETKTQVLRDNRNHQIQKLTQSQAWKTTRFAIINQLSRLVKGSSSSILHKISDIPNTNTDTLPTIACSAPPIQANEAPRQQPPSIDSEQQVTPLSQAKASRQDTILYTNSPRSGRLGKEVPDLAKTGTSGNALQDLSNNAGARAATKSQISRRKFVGIKQNYLVDSENSSAELSRKDSGIVDEISTRHL